MNGWVCVIDKNGLMSVSIPSLHVTVLVVIAFFELHLLFWLQKWWWNVFESRPYEMGLDMQSWPCLTLFCRVIGRYISG